MDGVKGRGKLQGLRRSWSRELVEEGGQEVRVVDLNGQFNKDILVPQARLLEAIAKPTSASTAGNKYLIWCTRTALM